jgi:hypothetical protein
VVDAARWASSSGASFALASDVSKREEAAAEHAGLLSGLPHVASR